MSIHLAIRPRAINAADVVVVRHTSTSWCYNRSRLGASSAPQCRRHHNSHSQRMLLNDCRAITKPLAIHTRAHVIGATGLLSTQNKPITFPKTNFQADGKHTDYAWCGNSGSGWQINASLLERLLALITLAVAIALKLLAPAQQKRLF